MSQAPAMPLWTDALIGDTTHLSAEEFGAYLLILIATWRNNGEPFADDDGRLARICRMTKARWTSKLRPALVGFFNLSDGSWRQKRLEKEWNYVARTSEERSASGKRGAEAKWRKHKETSIAKPSDLPMANGKQNDGTHTHTHKEEEKEESSTAEVVPLPARESAQEGGYAFDGKVVRLSHGDFNRWRTLFHGVTDIAAALTPLDEGMALENPRPKPKDVFFRASAYLAKKHEEAMKAKAFDDRPHRERYTNEGVFRKAREG